MLGVETVLRVETMLGVETVLRVRAMLGVPAMLRVAAMLGLPPAVKGLSEHFSEQPPPEKALPPCVAAWPS